MRLNNYSFLKRLDHQDFVDRPGRFGIVGTTSKATKELKDPTS